MSRLKTIMKSLGSIFSGFFVSLATFGVVISLIWALAEDSQSIKLIGAIIATAIAIGSGGFVIAWLGRSVDLKLSLAFGFFIGGFSFVYLLGFDMLVLVLASLSAIAAGAGGLLFRIINGRGKATVNFDSV